MTHERASAVVSNQGDRLTSYGEHGGPEHDHTLPDASDVPVVERSYELPGDDVPFDLPDEPPPSAAVTVPDVSGLPYDEPMLP